MTGPALHSLSPFPNGAWAYHNPVSINFGVGALLGLPASLEGLSKVLLVSTEGAVRRGHVEQVQALLGGRDVRRFTGVVENPDIAKLVGQVNSLPRESDVIVAIGGGSTIDSAKVLSFALGSGLEGDPLGVAVERGESPSADQCIPVIAIPTTAGTGSEVTPFATVWDRATRRKHSLSGVGLFPRSALVDPGLTLTASRQTTVNTGLDALSQGLEAFWNRRATPLTDALACRAVHLALENLLPLTRRLDDLTLRTHLMGASLMAGLAIAQTRTSLAHSISYPLTAHHGLSHGLACAFTLPSILDFSAASDPGRFERLAASVGEASASALSERLSALLGQLGVGAAIAGCGIGPNELAALKGELIAPGRANNHPGQVSPDVALLLAQDALQRLRS